MAELPGELEDLIGDLAEQEEDLMDEAQEISSSAIDSADKGAGWDAADGPISNNRAKGVTGNRLPSGQEIGGAVGRRPHGQVQRRVRGRRGGGQGRPQDPQPPDARPDHERPDQGPRQGARKAAPPAAARRAARAAKAWKAPARRAPAIATCNRLAGKQAALRNKAQGVDLQHFQVTGYHHQDLEKMIDVMKQVELDLKAGNYTERAAGAEGAVGGPATSSSTSRANSRSQKDATREPARPTSRRTSSAACRIPRPPAGRTSTANTSRPSPTATRPKPTRPPPSRPQTRRRKPAGTSCEGIDGAGSALKGRNISAQGKRSAALGAETRTREALKGRNRADVRQRHEDCEDTAWSDIRGRGDWKLHPWDQVYAWRPCFFSKGRAQLAALVAAVNLLALFSAWSFKGAFRGKLPPQDKSHEGNTANAEDGEGDSTDSQKNR